VPPSAWMTSQSIQIVRFPKEVRSTTERRERPINRWISWSPAHPAGTRFTLVRVRVERGSMEYSEVTHPCPESFKNRGTSSSTLAVQMTLVLPTRSEQSLQGV